VNPSLFALPSRLLESYGFPGTASVNTTPMSQCYSLAVISRLVAI
jgi:hypothetical protein